MKRYINNFEQTNIFAQHLSDVLFRLVASINAVVEKLIRTFIWKFVYKIDSGMSGEIFGFCKYMYPRMTEREWWLNVEFSQFSFVGSSGQFLKLL
jgi:hypothetical protein